jgi:hypothetical protein
MAKGKRPMFKFKSGRILLGLLLVAAVTLIGNAKEASAASGISSVTNGASDCSTIRFVAHGDTGAYAALRVWVGGVGGTTILDSYTGSYPSAYAALGNGFAMGFAHFAVLPAGTVITYRVYRAPAAAKESWDQGNFVDIVYQCATGVHDTGVGQLTCHSFTYSGYASEFTGYIGMRVWANGKALYDSYQAGFPSHFDTLNNGNFFNTVTFTPQPVGTVLEIDLYYAPQTVPGSWDGTTFYDQTLTCQG